MKIHTRRFMVFALFALGVLQWNPPFVAAQQGLRLGVGSTWSRRPFRPEPQRIGTNRNPRNSSQPPAGQRFFGGVTVGPGVLTFPPGYFGAIYDIPGYGYAYGYPPFGYVPSPVPIGGYSAPGLPLTPYLPYAIGNPYLTDVPAGPVQFGVGASTEPLLPGGDKEVSHAPAIPIASPQVSFDRGFLLDQPFTAEEAITWELVQGTVAAGLRVAPIEDEFGIEPPTLTSAKELIDRSEYLRLLRKGDTALAEGDPEEAVTFFERALAADAPLFHAWHRLAMARLCRSDLNGAAAALRAALTQDADSTVPMFSGNSIQGRMFADSEVWAWLMERPGSIDRLHLVAAWRAVEGDMERASELMKLAAKDESLNGLTERLKKMVVVNFNGRSGSHSLQSEIE